HVLQAHHYLENVLATVAVRVARVPCYIIGRHYSDHIYFLTRGLKRRAYLGVEGLCNHAASYVAVPATDVARLLTEEQRVPAEKVVTIPFGLDFRKYQPSSPGAPEALRREHGLEG